MEIMLQAAFLSLLITNTISLSPQEFRRFYEPQSQHQQAAHNRPYHPNTPFHNQNHNTHYYNPSSNQHHDDPYSTRRPFNPHHSYNIVSHHRPTINRVTRPPHRPNTFNTHNDNTFQQNGISLVKLRKLYSQQAATKRPQPFPTTRPYKPPNSNQFINPTSRPFTNNPVRPFTNNHVRPFTYPPLRPFTNHRTRPYTIPYSRPFTNTIPPEYIRNTFRESFPPSDQRFGLSSSHNFEQESVPRPSWSRYRKARNNENQFKTYMGPNNQSVILETRIHATVGVKDKHGLSEKEVNSQTNYLDGFNTLDMHRPKRYTLNKKLMHAFSSGNLGQACVTEEGDEGQCLTSPQCHMKKGMAKYSPDCTFGACCTHFIKSCGTTIRSNTTFWQTPRTENGTEGIASICFLKIEKLSSNICQMRLDFIEFKLKGPSNGSCLEDKLLVSGQNTNSVIPQLCGVASGDHVYIDVDNSTGPVELKFINVGNNFTRKWKIHISQIECNNPNRPPRNCLQYFMHTSGTFGSFNRQNTNKQYLNNINYAVCLRKGAGYCSVQYNLSPNDQFNFINQENNIATVPVGSAGVGAIDCPDDYIVIAGNRLCGDKFNDGSLSSMSENTKVKDATNGPFIVQVRSDASNVGEGFEFDYQQLPC